MSNLAKAVKVTIREPNIHDLNTAIMALQFPADEKGRKPKHIWKEQRCNATIDGICREVRMSANHAARDYYKDFDAKLKTSYPRAERIRFLSKLIADQFGIEQTKSLAPKIASIL